MSIELRIILACLATYRLTILLCTDEGPWAIFLRLRDFARRYTGLLECAHCTGVWCAVVMALMLVHQQFDFILVVLGLAGAQSFMESCLEKKWKILGDE